MAAVDLWGIHEIADAYEVDRQTVYYWRRKPGFPAPLADLKMGPVWDAREILKWKRKNIRPRRRPVSDQ